jgi:hypothetical protein
MIKFSQMLTPNAALSFRFARLMANVSRAA